MNDLEFMNLAIDEAKEAGRDGDVPVGAVMVCDGRVVAKARNTREFLGDATGHAEINAIRDTCKALGGWHLDRCTLYVTLEPCPMCMGASLNARVSKIYFGAYEQKGRSLTNELAEANLLNHKTEVVGGVLESECSSLLTDFFSSMRKKAKEEKEQLKREEQDASLKKE